MIKPKQLAKKKIIEFGFIIMTIIEHTLTLGFLMVGIFSLNWLALKLGLVSSYPIILLREISEYSLLGMYLLFVTIGIVYIYKIFKELEV